jgi:hypothetical protein
LTLIPKNGIFGIRKEEAAIMKRVKDKVVNRIYGKGRGWCFTPKAFHDVGDPKAIKLILHRLEKRGTIRRIARGLYDYPRMHPTIGILSPKPEEIARAISSRDAARLQPSGAYAANLLGLTEHVPARIVFLTDGAGRRVKIGRQEIALKNTTPRNMATAGKISSTVIQALRHVGQKQITKKHIEHLRKALTADHKKQLRHDRIYAPGWMHSVIDAIMRDADARIRKVST